MDDIEVICENVKFKLGKKIWEQIGVFRDRPHMSNSFEILGIKPDVFKFIIEYIENMNGVDIAEYMDKKLDLIKNDRIFVFDILYMVTGLRIDVMLDFCKMCLQKVFMNINVETIKQWEIPSDLYENIKFQFPDLDEILAKLREIRGNVGK